MKDSKRYLHSIGYIINVQLQDHLVLVTFLQTGTASQETIKAVAPFLGLLSLLDLRDFCSGLETVCPFLIVLERWYLR